MAFLLAAGLGNVLALCVHSLAWSLRNRARTLMFCLGVASVILYLGVLTWMWHRDNQSYSPTSPFVILPLSICLFLFPSIFGVWHYRVFKTQSKTVTFAVLSFYAEAAIAVLAFIGCAKVYDSYFWMTGWRQ